MAVRRSRVSPSNFKPLARHGMTRALAPLVWAVLATCMLAQPGYAQEDREAALKAGFLFNFAKFTEWPANRFRSDSDPVIFCLGRNSRLKDALAVLPEKLVGTHPISLAVLPENADPAGCHVLFVDDTAPVRLRQLAESGVYGVLTVSDLPNFARAGGNIGFVSGNNQLRFQINLDTARRSGIGFSSKLLRLAEVIGQQASLYSRIAAVLFGSDDRL
jgi:hypothetical protein